MRGAGRNHGPTSSLLILWLCDKMPVQKLTRKNFSTFDVLVLFSSLFVSLLFLLPFYLRSLNLFTCVTARVALFTSLSLPVLPFLRSPSSIITHPETNSTPPHHSPPSPTQAPRDETPTSPTPAYAPVRPPLACPPSLPPSLPPPGPRCRATRLRSPREHRHRCGRSKTQWDRLGGCA